MSATKEQLEEELKSLNEQHADLTNKHNQNAAYINQVAGAIQALQMLLTKHYSDEPKIVVPTAQQAAAVTAATREQRQGEEQKRTLRFPVPTVQ
jgi:iron-sulfur cluster repair protein YtfE (RIC family)